MKELSERARAMLDALNEADSPGTDVQARTWAAIASRAATGDMGPTLGPEPSSTMVGGTMVTGKIAWIVSSVVAALGIAAAIVIGVGNDEPATQTMTINLEDTQPATQPSLAEPMAAPVPELMQPDAEPRALRAERASDPSKPDDPPATIRPRVQGKTITASRKTDNEEPMLEAEIMLMAEARAALGSGDAARAVRLFERHAKNFPHGEFSIEREVSWITALCVLAQTSTAQIRAEKFLAKYPQSPHAAKVRASCGGQAPK